MTERPDSDEARRPDLSTLCFAPEESDQAFLSHPSPALLFERSTRRIIAANVAAEALYGWSCAELNGMTLEDLWPEASRARLQADLRRLDLTGSSGWYRAVHLRRDGELVEVEVLSQPMCLEGRPVHRAIIIDVTARTRAEALFRGVAEQSLTGIYVMQDGRFAYMNPRLADMFGYRVDDVLGDADPLRRLTAEARALVASMSAGRLEGRKEAVKYTVRAKRRDGSPIIVEVYGSSLVLNGRPALLGTVLDVTERASADAALEESERRFRAAFDQAMTGMVLTAPDGRVLRVNRALCQLLGYSPEEMVRITFPSMIHPDDQESIQALREGSVAGGLGEGRPSDQRFIHKDGSVVWATLNSALVSDESGEPLYMMSQMTDLTARKRAEAALNESEAQLRQAQKMEAVGRLAGGVAHDFNNLLTVIGSNAEIGAELADEGHAAPEEFAEIRAAVDRAASLTRQLLAFSRRQVLAPASLSLNVVVADAERMLRRVIGEDVLLETRLDRHAGTVFADRGQLEQVLMNLIVNARDAMPDGGRIVIATRRESDGQIALTVTDTGVGMDPETQARAFEPFFTTKEVGKGTGLGLSTVYGIAQQTGGDVAILSTPGMGTTITVTLPSNQVSSVSGAPSISSVADDAPHSETTTGTAKGDTILLVEDEAAVRTVARRILTRVGYRVIEARNGAEALFLWSLHRSRVRLVLTDAVMPLMGGIELVTSLREAGANVPMLFMSGYADSERGGEMPVGADLIGKPFTAEGLVERVGELIALHPDHPARRSAPVHPLRG